jgi:hypothetical protein
MRRPASLAILTLLTLAASVTPASAESAAAALAAQAPTVEDQCRLLHAVCHAAVVATGRVGTTPWSGVTDALIDQQTGKAALAIRDARDVARVIERRNGGRHLQCFDDPECTFLRKAEPAAPPRPAP